MAKTKKENTEELEGQDKLSLKLKDLNKKYGAGTVMSFSESAAGGYDIIPTGSSKFDNILGIGGYARGKLYEFRGWEGCLDKDTYIKFLAINKETGTVRDCKGGSIENLYKRFHNINSRPSLKLDSEYYVVSVNEENRIIRNKIADVVKTGSKECFEITTQLGFKIKATKDHKFYVGTHFIPLGDLKIGGEVYIHNNSTFKGRNKNQVGYKEVFVKYYYRGNKKKVVDSSTGKSYFYNRVKNSRLTYEASLNNISLTEYVTLLNSGITKLPDNWVTIPEGMQIHHKDENKLNDDLSNLELVDPQSHGRIHAIDRHNNLRFVAIPDKIISITPVGYRETYDIKCYYPHNNFVASGFIVHNSGKTTICGEAVASAQSLGLNVVYIDGEHALDIDYFRSLGVDTDKLIISQPDNGEQGFDTAIELIETGEIGLVIIDSDSSLIPKKVLEGEIGDANIGKKAKLNSDVYPKLKIAIKDYNTACLVVSQYREKIGVMFGDPRTTQGGHALKFSADCIVEFSKTQQKDGDDVYAIKVTAKTLKNKMAPPFKKTDFNILFGYGIDTEKEIYDLAEELEILSKYGKKITYNEVVHEMSSSDSAISEFVDILRDNEELFLEIKNKVIEKLKSNG